MLNHSAKTLFCILLFTLLPIFASADRPFSSTFSTLTNTEALYQDWQIFNVSGSERLTQYRLVNENGTRVVRALSNNSASGLYLPARINPQQYPVIEWRWKVPQTLTHGDALSKSGDDYAARIYIEFEYDIERLDFFTRLQYETYKVLNGRYPPVAVINYIWANRLPVGEYVDNIYSDRVKMFAVKSGNHQSGKWHRESRNIVDDYQRAFGEPPGNIKGIAIMTDTDNTTDKTIAFYGDIMFHKAAAK